MASTPTTPTSVRVDAWVWAVRLYATRSAAAAACRAGHVSIGGRKVKPSQTVHVGDRVEALTAGGLRDVEVARLLLKRVGAAVAAECFIDHTPAPPPREERPFVPTRDRGAGRPTKRDRRQMDRWRGR